MSSSSLTFHIQPSTTLQGQIRVPSDKSISHRAILLGAIAEGNTHIQHCLLAEDCLAMLQAFRNMGVQITYNAMGEVNIVGVGLHGLQAPTTTLNLGNSGTAIRLLAGLLAGQNFSSILTGDTSLCRRPMRRVIQPLQQMGAHINAYHDEYPPLEIAGGHSLHGITYSLPMASAQVKTCLLLAGLYAQGETQVIEPAITRDHTERMLQTFGYPLQQTHLSVKIVGEQQLRATEIIIPADLSSAAFFLVGASIAKDSKVILKQVGINPTRIGVINILRLMGAAIEIQLVQLGNNSEPIADLIVRYAPLQGIVIPLEQVSLAIDEFPALFIAAACAKGTTVLQGAKELRVKESDRIGVMVEGLRTLGIKIIEQEDGVIIEGGKIGGGSINSHGDHRIAMAFSMAALVAENAIYIKDCANVATSFPNFVDLAQRLGLQITSSSA
ncbi:3-phosphoshikimate 1-carboxyvinyltransferase [soil metagenome]